MDFMLHARKYDGLKKLKASYPLNIYIYHCLLQLRCEEEFILTRAEEEKTKS